jgi:hypothetical protein
MSPTRTLLAVVVAAAVGLLSACGASDSSARDSAVVTVDPVTTSPVTTTPVTTSPVTTSPVTTTPVTTGAVPPVQPAPAPVVQPGSPRLTAADVAAIEAELDTIDALLAGIEGDLAQD